MHATSQAQEGAQETNRTEVARGEPEHGLVQQTNRTLSVGECNRGEINDVQSGSIKKQSRRLEMVTGGSTSTMVNDIIGERLQNKDF